MALLTNSGEGRGAVSADAQAATVYENGIVNCDALIAAEQVRCLRQSVIRH